MDVITPTELVVEVDRRPRACRHKSGTTAAQQRPSARTLTRRVWKGAAKCAQAVKDDVKPS